MIPQCRPTSPELLARMVGLARNYKMTPAEVKAQRISFVYGQIGGDVSKAEIARILYGDEPEAVGPSGRTDASPGPGMSEP
jgi:hypothetical protein